MTPYSKRVHIIGNHQRRSVRNQKEEWETGVQNFGNIERACSSFHMAEKRKWLARLVVEKIGIILQKRATTKVKKKKEASQWGNQ